MHFLGAVARSKYDIVLIQEHHLDDSEAFGAQNTAALYGFIAHFSADPSGGPTAGVGVLLRIQTTIQRREEAVLTILDPGRAIFIYIKSLPAAQAIINIYAPNSHRDQFFATVHSALRDKSQDTPIPDECILAGDFNCVPSTQLDYSPARGQSNAYDNNGADELLELTLDLGLGDLFRNTNPSTRIFTWGFTSPSFS